MSERLSIIIVHHNRIHYLKTTIKSILENTIHPFELLIYDNASGRPDVRFLQKFEEESPVPTKVFYGKRNIGVWQASNILIAHASSRATLGFIKCDNDVIVKTKGWATKWMELASELPQVAFIGANAEGIRKRNRGIKTVKHKRRDILIRTSSSTGVCVYWPGRSFVKYGFYQESYGCMGQGDKDIGERAKAEGQWFVYDSSVTVTRHKPGRHDHYGGYRRWKNRYVKNNKAILYRNIEEYKAGKRSTGIWYKKFDYAIPESVKNDPNFQYSDDRVDVDWDTGVPLDLGLRGK